MTFLAVACLQACGALLALSQAKCQAQPLSCASVTTVPLLVCAARRDLRPTLQKASVMIVTLQSCFRYGNHLHDHSAAIEEHCTMQSIQYRTHSTVQCNLDMHCCPTVVCLLACRFHEYAAGHSAAELVSEQERASIASKLVQQHKEQQAAQEAAAAEAAAAAQAAQVAAEQNAATAAQAAGNTDTAQAMDTTADGDDAFDATAQETVAAAGHMMANIDAPAAATTADSSAADDAPVAEAGPDAANPVPSMLTVPTPDDIAATLLAGAATAATGSDVPTAAAPLSVPPATETSLPASAPPAGFALAPPQAYPTTAAGLAVDTDMPQVTIPQSDGPGDDPMDEAATATEAAAAPPAPAAFTDPSSAASSDTSVAAGYAVADPATASLATEVAGYAVADPVTTSLATEVAPMQTSADPALQAAAPGPEAAIAGMTVPEAPQAAAPATAEELITDEQIKGAWLASVDEVYTVTKEEWYSRKPFEDAIKRPYFHVKPLDLAQLQNWSR